ncbi:MAG: hypothetical protein ABSC37_05965 [Xanthobacteraceae bacterium]|jgi:hypothetical protein
MKARFLIASGILLAALTSAAAQTTPPPPTKFQAGRQTFFARERACAADWKADKAAGKIAAGMKWPKYLSECNKRKKAEGM